MDGPLDVTDHLATAWRAVTGAPERPAPIEVVGPRGALPSNLPVAGLAEACVGVALSAASELHAARGGTRPAVTIDRDHVADAVRSERYFRRGERPAGMSFAPLSRFWPTADDRWIRTHANYPWHREALLHSLGLNDDADADAVAAQIVSGGARELEQRIVDAGGIAAAVRTLEEWSAHPQGASVADEPLVGTDDGADAPPRSRSLGSQPATGVRVLDLTRVIAGPVATRLLGALGADVLRLDPPGRPDGARGRPMDTLLAKRSAFLDATDATERLHALIDDADVVVCGYRPGSLDRFGLSPDALAERHPGVVSVHLAAWGHTGPWSQRRGFDSIVQVASGIAVAESPDGDQPGALPCQLLDHGTGYLVAAAALDGLRRQMSEGGTPIRRLSLARTAWWLTHAGPAGPTPDAPPPDDDARWTVELPTTEGSVTAVRPPGAFDGEPLRWPGAPARYGTDDPAWM